VPAGGHRPRLGITSNWVVVRMAGSAVRKGS
jgi:hypothetical protein